MRIGRTLPRLGLALLFVAGAARATTACSSESPAAVTSPSPTSGATGTPTGTTAPTDAGSNDAGDGGEIGPPCLGDGPGPDGGAPDCTANGCGTACDDVRAHFRTEVAAFATACIANLPSCAKSSNVIACVQLAMARGCAAPTAATFCAPLVTGCDPQGFAISQQGCEAFAQTMTDAGREVFATCIETKIDAGTCSDEVGACADEIRQ